MLTLARSRKRLSLFSGENYSLHSTAHALTYIDNLSQSLYDQLSELSRSYLPFPSLSL